MAYKILFKKQGLSDEWSKLLLLNPKLVRIVLEVCGMLPGESLTITEIFRTQEMQRSYYPGNPGQLSVHQFWRGVDIRTAGISETTKKAIVPAINNRWAYGKQGTNTALIHDIGLGDHLHLQTIDGGLRVP